MTAGPALLGVAASVVLALGAGAAAASPVPRRITEERVAAEVAKQYAFPWAGTAGCEALVPGCFRVEAVHDHEVTIAYERFVVREGRIVPQRFVRREVIGPEGTAEALFVIEQEPPRQLWVHAAWEGAGGGRGAIRFIQLPAFVTRRARIYRTTLLDLGAQSLKDRARIEAEEPVTLIPSAPVDRTIPGAWTADVRVNGQPPAFVLPRVTSLNLPPGTSDLETEIRWREDLPRVCPWPLYEGRKMSLPVETRLIVRTAGRAPLEVSLSSFGLPREVWERAGILRAVYPAPVSREERPLATILRFPAVHEIVLTITPILRVERFTFPVLVCVEEREAAAGRGSTRKAR